jgi:chromosome segregation ATPase
MNNLKSKFEAHKKPLDDEKETLKQVLLDKKDKMQQKKDEIKSLRVEIDELNEDLTVKENLIKELNVEMENIPKQESTKFSNRQFYTKRILEIVANIDKQKKEIDKVFLFSENDSTCLNNILKGFLFSNLDFD